ncbi:aromatic compound dioxygenase [Hypoxylon sp. FL0543]|nr:aromatic compound dioxygenase [Hypoxylon sp. FL0543]
MAVVEKREETNGDVAKLTYDPDFTDAVIAATGPNAHPRLKQIMPSLIRHLHDFAREVGLTVAEWAEGVELINEAGRMSTDKRNETQLLCDILGLESLVDEITSSLLSASGPSDVTPSCILGPFYRANAPLRPNGGSIVQAAPDSDWYKSAEPLLAHVHGRVLSATTGEPIPDVILEVWQAGPNGLYEQQDEAQPDMNLRGRFRTDSEGRYAMICLRPTAYPVPSDGPGGRLLQMLDRHPWRPAHIHFIVSREGFRTLTTQIFDVDDGHIADDSVFAVKDELLVKFEKREAEGKGKERAHWTLQYDFSLCEV